MTAVRDAVTAYNSLSAAEKAKVAPATLKALIDAAVKAGVTPPTTDLKAPTVENDAKLTASAVKGTLADLGEVISNGAGGSIILIEDAVEGTVYETTFGGETYTSFIEEGATAINFDGLAPEDIDTTAPVTVTENRIKVEADNKVSVTLYETDDLAELAKSAEGSLTEDADVTITLADGKTTLSTTLTADNAVQEVLKFLSDNGQTAADLIDNEYKVVLTNKVDQTKSVTYTLVF